MRTLLVFFALVALTLAQMTFTDQWNKRSSPTDSFASFKTAGRASLCSRQEINEMLLQLSQLQAAQKEIVADLNTCASIKKL